MAEMENKEGDKKPLNQNKPEYGTAKEEGGAHRDYGYKIRRSWVLPVLVLLLILLGGLLWWTMRGRVGKQTTTANFGNEQKTSNFVKSIPVHGETLPAVPAAVIIQFNGAVTAPNSNIAMVKDGKDYGFGDAIVGRNGLTTRRLMDQDSPDGLYTANYKTCGTDGNCQNGSFQFKLDRTTNQGFQDLRTQKAVTVKYTSKGFDPVNILISRGTKVTFINDSGQTLPLNSDNKRLVDLAPVNATSLAPGASISFTVNATGLIEYKITVNGSDVGGKIIVE